MSFGAKNGMARVLSEINIQFFARFFTFVINAVIIRYISSDLLGVINVRLMLLYSTTQFLSRESLRRVCLSEAKSNQWSSLVNLMWLNLPFCFMIGYLLSYIWLNHLEKPDPDVATGYELAVMLIPFAVIIEMLSEPMYIYIQLKDKIGIRLKVEMLVLFVRCLGMAIFVPKFPHQSIFIFTTSLLISSILQTFYYFFYCKIYIKDIAFRSFFPRKTPIKFSLVTLTSSFMLHTIVKQILTEGERYIMTFFNPLTFAEQGIFDLVNNLGALPARLLFKPIEDTAYRSFSEIVSREKTGKKDKLKALELRQKLLKVVILFGLTILVFGFNYSRLALILYKPEIEQNIATSLMRWHCFYDLVIAVNGITEAFSLAAMPNLKIANSILWYFILSVLYIITSISLVTIMGASGLVLANCISMFLRIAYSSKFVKDWHPNHKIFNGFIDSLPDTRLLLVYCIIFTFTYLSEIYFCCASIIQLTVHILIGAILLIVLLISIAKTEHECFTVLLNFIEALPIFKLLKIKRD